MYDDDTHHIDGPATGDSTESSATRISDYQRRDGRDRPPRRRDRRAVGADPGGDLRAPGLAARVRPARGLGPPRRDPAPTGSPGAPPRPGCRAREGTGGARARAPAGAHRGDAQGRGLVLQGAGADADRDTGDRAELLELARAGTAAHVERIVRGCRRAGPKQQREKDRRCSPVAICTSARRGRDGDCPGAARAGGGCRLPRAIDAAAEALSHARSQTPTKHPSSRDTAAESTRPDSVEPTRWASLAESALAAGLDPGTAGTVTRSWSTSTPRRSPRRPSREPASPTVETFPRKRPGGWPAMHRPS